ncbi:MAG: ATP-binding protein [Gemmataceae bacterium]
MPQPGTLAAALAHLPQWWQDGGENATIELLLASWVRACGWKSAGFLAPADGVAKSAPGLTHIEHSEQIDALNRLRAGEPTLVVSVPGGTSRVYAPVMCPGRPLAALWAERAPGFTWSEADHAYIATTAKAAERSPVVIAALGASFDPERANQRLADAGVVAGRMAHDFDNILTGILGFTDLALPLTAPGTLANSHLSEIAKVGQRGIAFTQQLHAFNRAGEPKPTPGSVAATLGREEARLKPQVPPGVKIEKELPVNLPAVAIDAAPLQAALGHLFENAIEACGKTGHVRISAKLAEFGESEARGYLGKCSPGPHLIVSFADSGPGIKPEVRKRLIAEPFFTTKVRHRGLGLATAYRIATAHRGGLQIDSVPAPGTGTIVRLALPLAVSRPSVNTPTPPPSNNAGLRDESVRVAADTATIVRG